MSQPELRCMQTYDLVNCIFKLGEEDDQLYEVYEVESKDTSADYDYYECETKQYYTKCTNTNYHQSDQEDQIKWMEKIPDGHSKLKVQYKTKSYYIFYKNVNDLFRKLRNILTSSDILFVQFIKYQVTPYANSSESHAFGFFSDDQYSAFHEAFNKLKFDKSDEFKAILIQNNDDTREEEKSPYDKTKIQESVVYTNLQWARNSCWIDTVLINLFTFRFSLNEKILRYIRDIRDKRDNRFDDFILKLINQTTTVSVMDYIGTMYEISEKLTKDGQVKNLIDGKDTKLYLPGFTEKSLSSAGLSLLFFNSYFKLNIRTLKTTPIDGKQNTVELIKHYLLTYNFVDSQDYIVVDTTSQWNSDTMDILNEKYYQIKKNDKKFKLASAIVGQQGHYVSIIFDPTTEKYILVNKLVATTISEPTVNDWKQITFLFYLKEDLVNSENILTTSLQSGGANKLSNYYKTPKYYLLKR